MRFDDSGSRCWLIAEVAQAHDGSLGTAHAYVDAVAKAGADAVKFQTHIANAESTEREPWRVKFSLQDGSRRDYWKRMEFSEPQWFELLQHAKERGLEFLSSAFSLEAVDLLERIGVPAWKVGAGEISNLPMIERMARTGKPVLLSSGMSRWSEMDAAVETVRRCAAPQWQPCSVRVAIRARRKKSDSTFWRRSGNGIAVPPVFPTTRARSSRALRRRLSGRGFWKFT